MPDTPCDICRQTETHDVMCPVGQGPVSREPRPDQATYDEGFMAGIGAAHEAQRALAEHRRGSPTMPDTLRPGHNHPLDSICLVSECPRGAYDAGKRARLDALTAAVREKVMQLPDHHERERSAILDLLEPHDA